MPRSAFTRSNFYTFFFSKFLIYLKLYTTVYDFKYSEMSSLHPKLVGFSILINLTYRINNHKKLSLILNVFAITWTRVFFVLNTTLIITK